VTDFEGLLRVLVEGGVEIVLVGGLAARAHGAARSTQDVDVVYARTPENLERLARALGPHHPVLRGEPKGLPFRLDVPTLRSGLNFTLTTDLGDIDLLGEIAGGGTYESLRGSSRELELFGLPVRCIDLDALIRTKRAAGRPRDLEAIAELEALREERDNQIP